MKLTSAEGNKMKLNAFKIVAVYLALSLVWLLLSRGFILLFHDRLTAETINVIVELRPYCFFLISSIFVFKLVVRNNRIFAEKENDYQSLYTANPNPLWIYDQETLQFISVNNAAVAFYGYPREEFLSMTIKDIRPLEDREKVVISSRQVSDTRYSSGILRHRKKSGNIIYVNITSHKIRFNHRDCIMVLAVDHTSRVIYEKKLMQMNQVLKEEKQKLKETEKLARVSGWEYFIENGKLIWSDELYEIFDLDRLSEDVNYEQVLKSIHQEDLPAYNLAIENLLANGKDLDISYRFITKTGRIKYVKVLGKMQYQEQQKFKVVGTMQDITELKLIQQEKNSYQQRLKNTLNNIAEGYYQLNRDWKITAVNTNFEKMLGLKQQDVVNHSYLEIFPAPSSLKFYDYLKKVLEEGLHINFEGFSVRHHKWFCMNAYPTDEGAAVYFTDITEDKEKDLQLKEALERYDLVAKATRDVIYDYDAPSGKINYSNSIGNFLGISSAEIGSDLAWLKTIIHPEDVDGVIHNYQHAIEQHLENQSIEYRVQTANNQYKYVYDQGYLQYDQENNFVRMIGAIKDIDQLKKFDQENKRLADIITKVNNMIVIQDVNHKITWVNKAFENFTGYHLWEVIGKYPHEILNGPETDLHTSDAVTEVKDARQHFSFEVVNYTRAQKKYWVNIEFTPLFDQSGLPSGYISIHNNITAQKEKEQRVSRQNEILRNIAWMSSHELRRPVASILGLINLINVTDDEDDKTESIRMMNTCTQDLDAIIHKINERIEQEISGE